MAGSPARKEVGRVGVKVVPDTSEFGRELRTTLAKWSKETVTIKVVADLKKFDADLKKATRNRVVEVRVKLDSGAATAELDKTLRDRDVQVKVNLDATEAKASIAQVTRKARKAVNVDLDAGKAEAKIKEVTRPETKHIKVEVDKSSLSSLSGVLKGFGGAAIGALVGVTGAVGQTVSSFGALGSSAQGALSGMTKAGGAASTALGSAASAVAGLVASLAQMAGTVLVITAVVAAIGSLIVAAVAAAAAIGAVVIGAAALVAVPLIFAAIAASTIKHNKELKEDFKTLGQTISTTMGQVTKPMVEALSGSIKILNDALQKGTPLYLGLRTAFAASASALTPLTQGLLNFSKGALAGLNTALGNLNKSGFFTSIALSLGTLGLAFGSFFASLSTWAPAFQAGFTSIANAALKLAPSIANLFGSFASFAPGVINTLASAFQKLFDAFSNNSAVYGTAAQAFANALEQMAPALEAVAAAFAKMAPDILATMANAVSALATQLSDPATIAGITLLTTGLINFAAAAAGAAVSMAATVGNTIEDFAVMADTVGGTLKDTATVSTSFLLGLVTQADSAKEAASNLQRQLTLSFGTSVKNSVNAMHDMGTQWQASIEAMSETTQSGSIALNKGFQDRFLGLLNTVKFNGTAMDAEWVKTFEGLVSTTAASGDKLAVSMSGNMGKILNVLKTGGPQGIEQVKAMLQGMDDQVMASQIAAAMNIKMNETNATIKAGAVTAQATMQSMGTAFADIIKTSKTPEEMSSRLAAMNIVIGAKATEGAAAFKKLPDGMATAITAEQVVPGVTAIMTGVTTAITTGVGTAKTAFATLPKALSATVISDGTIVAGMKGQMTKVTAAIKTGATQATTAFKLLPTQMAAAAKADKTPDTIKSNMTKVTSNIKSGVTTGVASFKSLASQAAAAGQLSGFVSAVTGAMSRARGAVSSAVSAMIASLSSLNRTFAGPTVSAPKVQASASKVADSSFTADVQPMLKMSAAFVTPMASTVSANEAAVTSLAQGINNYARNMKVRDALDTTKATAQRVYNITVNAAPNVPTEESLRRQLSYADTLYE
ncbi:hypothetical protein [Streptosporangium subroseum]|uniref:hypothetical protein n=1 Tax=Streptosporangium subroseum TaxID=106412 RepID=UPI003092F63E|nr:hypothetical protein OHB15_14120 [Streptosporangium subroseum]